MSNSNSNSNYIENIVSEFSHKNGIPFKRVEKIKYLEQVYEVLVKKSGYIERKLVLSSEKNDDVNGTIVKTHTEVDIDPRIYFYEDEIHSTTVRNDVLEKSLVGIITKQESDEALLIRFSIFTFGVLKFLRNIFLIDFTNNKIATLKTVEDIAFWLKSKGVCSLWCEARVVKMTLKHATNHLIIKQKEENFGLNNNEDQPNKIMCIKSQSNEVTEEEIKDEGEDEEDYENMILNDFDEMTENSIPSDKKEEEEEDIDIIEVPKKKKKTKKKKKKRKRTEDEDGDEDNRETKRRKRRR